MKRIVVAIDGPAAAGKSSTATWVADVLGFRHVDSGALYRAITAARLREAASAPGDDAWSEEAVLAAAARCGLSPAGAVSFLPTIDSAVVETEIRSAAVNRNVSTVASMPRVREWVNRAVRGVASEHDIVVDGRDMGTTVFPDAALKIFLIADPWERARRRLIQSLGRNPKDEEIAAETERLVQRDSRDATQSAQARDAILLDTTYLTQEEQVQRIVALVRAVTRHPGDTSAIDLT